MRVIAVVDVDRLELLPRRLARDVDARADVRVEPLVAEELVVLADRHALLLHGHRDEDPLSACR